MRQRWIKVNDMATLDAKRGGERRSSFLRRVVEYDLLGRARTRPTPPHMGRPTRNHRPVVTFIVSDAVDQELMRRFGTNPYLFHDYVNALITTTSLRGAFEVSRIVGELPDNGEES